MIDLESIEPFRVTNHDEPRITNFNDAFNTMGIICYTADLILEECSLEELYHKREKLSNALNLYNHKSASYYAVTNGLERVNTLISKLENI